MPTFLFWIVFCWFHFVPIQVSGTPQVTFKMMAPILGFRYDVLCEVMMLSEMMDWTYFSKSLTISSDTQISCEVKGWRFCNRPIMSQQNGDCGCASKTSSPNGHTLYLFFMVIDPVTEDYMGAEFTCRLEGIKDVRAMEIVKFTRWPNRLLYTCKNATVILKWDFTPVQESIRNHFVVSMITWKSSGRASSKEETALGTATYKEDTMGFDFYNENNPRTMLISDESRIPQLALLNVQESDSKQNVSINVMFNTNKMPSRLMSRREANLELKHNSSLLLGFLSDISLDEIFPDPKDNLTSPTSATTNPDEESSSPDMRPGSTIRTDKPQGISTTTPSPINFQLPEPINYMADTISLVVTEPPSAELVIVVKAYQSVTGNLVITCDVSHMYFPGEPPVNVSIWHDERRLASRSGISTLHFSTDVGGKAISCGLEGHALDCLPESDVRRERVVFDLRDLSKIIVPNTSVDMLLSMYAWQCTIVIILLFWVVSLLLDHIMLIIRIRKRRAMVELTKAEQPKYKRFSVWSILSYQRKRSRV